MIVKTLAHGRLVVSRLQRILDKETLKDISVDTETVPKAPWKGKKDALIFDRQKVCVFSVCRRGESYSFPTNALGSFFPTIFQWMEIWHPIFSDSRIIKVGQNFKYDLHVFSTSAGESEIRPFWDTMLGAWLANPAIEKGLKSRALLYGRHLRKTSTIDFSNIDELAEYAEEDVVQTDEMFQMQKVGIINRPAIVKRVTSEGKLRSYRNNLPSGSLAIPLEGLDKFRRLWMAYHEYPFLQATVRAERRGFPLNSKGIQDIRVILQEDIQKSLKKVYRMAGRTFNTESGKQLREVFTELGVEMPYLTKTGQPSLDASSLFKMQGFHEIVPQVLQYRKLYKLNSVYISDKGLQYYVNPASQRIHCTLNTAGAVTGRTSCSLPNLQQIPQRGDTYGIRDCFVPPKGKSLVCLDYAQLEIRVMALMCKDPAMTQILRDPKGDIHQNTADEFGVDRSPTAKQLNFLLLYGGQEYMLSEKLTTEGVPTTPAQAKAYRDRYNQVYYRVAEFRQELLAHHQEHGYIRILTGRRRWINDIDWTNRRSIHKAETTLSNNCIQSGGQDLLKASIIRIDPTCVNVDSVLPSRMAMTKSHKLKLKDYAWKLENKLRPLFRLAKLEWILQVHDEAIWFVEDNAAEEVGQAIADIMTWRHFFPAITSYSVPITVEGGVGTSWKHAKSKTPTHKIHAGF